MPPLFAGEHYQITGMKGYTHKECQTHSHARFQYVCASINVENGHFVPQIEALPLKVGTLSGLFTVVIACKPRVKAKVVAVLK